MPIFQQKILLSNFELPIKQQERWKEELTSITVSTAH
jgi:hypothetical protein